MKNHNDKLNRETCPDEILINNYALHRCSKEERQEIETHLIKCPFCRREVVFLIKSRTEAPTEGKKDELPEQMFNHCMGLVKNFQKKYYQNNYPFQPYETVKELAKDFQGLTLEIVLKFVNGNWKISRHTGTFIPQPVLSAREEARAEKMAISSPIIKEFKGYLVEVNLEKNEEGGINFKIKAKKSLEMCLIPQVHFILCDEKQLKIVEDFVHDGVAFFEGIKPGKYSIEIIQQDKLIAHIPIELPKE